MVSDTLRAAVENFAKETDDVPDHVEAAMYREITTSLTDEGALVVLRMAAMLDGAAFQADTLKGALDNALERFATDCLKGIHKLPGAVEFFQNILFYLGQPNRKKKSVRNKIERLLKIKQVEKKQGERMERIWGQKNRRKSCLAKSNGRMRPGIR